MFCRISSLLHCESRFFQKTRFKNHKFLVFSADLIHFVVADCKTGKFYKKVRERKPYKCCRDIEYTVCDCDRCRCCHLCHKRKMHSCVDHIEKYHKRNGSDQVEIQMDHCRTLCVFVCTDCRKKCCHTGTDILSHDDRECRTIRNRSCHTKCLQDTYRCRR